MVSSPQIFLHFLRHCGLMLGHSFALIEPTRRVVVEQWKAMDEADYDDAVAIAQALPGFFAMNFAVSLSHRLAGWRGSVSAALGLLLPAMAVGIVVAALVRWWGDTVWLARFWMGVRPAAVALLFMPFVRLGKAARLTASNFFIPLVALGLMVVMRISPMWIVAAVCTAGFVYGKYIQPALKDADKDKTTDNE